MRLSPLLRTSEPAYDTQTVNGRRSHEEAVARKGSMIDQELLDILACPSCKTPVHLEGDRIVCDTCGRRYPVRDGIPVMLIEEAELGPGAAQAPPSS